MVNIYCKFSQKMKRTERRHLCAEQFWPSRVLYPVPFPFRPYYMGWKWHPWVGLFLLNFLHEIRKFKPLNAENLSNQQISLEDGRYYSCRPLIHTAWIVNMQELQCTVLWILILLRNRGGLFRKSKAKADLWRIFSWHLFSPEYLPTVLASHW